MSEDALAILTEKLKEEQHWANVYSRESMKWFEEAVQAKRDLLLLLRAASEVCFWLNNELDNPNTCAEYKTVIRDLLKLVYELNPGGFRDHT